mmetsp:Transcript_850/g.1332  ORF Transcript_850/g.1332 Transcript_850/m.1332 type:complete len:339 (+) Transcript_850:147-1163(+)
MRKSHKSHGLAAGRHRRAPAGAAAAGVLLLLQAAPGQHEGAPLGQRVLEALQVDPDDGRQGHREDHARDAPDAAPDHHRQQHRHGRERSRVADQARLEDVLGKHAHRRRPEEGRARRRGAELRVEEHERHRQHARDGEADVGHEVEPEGDDAEDEPQVDADDAQDGRVAQGHEQRDGHLPSDVHVDLLLRLRVHVGHAVTARRLPREEEGEEEEDVDDVLRDVRGGAQQPHDERLQVEVGLGQLGDGVLHLVGGAVAHGRRQERRLKLGERVEDRLKELLRALGVLVAVSGERADRARDDEREHPKEGRGEGQRYEDGDASWQLELARCRVAAGEEVD